jgi:hypothetical protein
MHRRIDLVTSNGGAGTSVATATLGIGQSDAGRNNGTAALVRFIAVDFGAVSATCDLVIKADNSTGATIFTGANSATDIAPTAVGAPSAFTALATASAFTNTAATDATAGGFPVRGGVFIDVAQADALIPISIDIWFDIVRFVVVRLDPIGGAGTSVVTKTVNIGGAGVIRAISCDVTTPAATTDILIKENDTAGRTLLSMVDVTADFSARPVTLAAGIDEGRAAIAVTDGSSGGLPFRNGLFFDVAQADDSSTGAKPIIFELWIDT